MTYWEATLSEILGDHGVLFSAEQLAAIAKDVELSANVQGEYQHQEGGKSSAERELKFMKDRHDAHQKWILSTKKCSTCLGAGLVKDFLGSIDSCMDCHGQGRVSIKAGV